MKTHLTTAEAAERLGLHIRTVQILAASGELAAERIGRLFLIPIHVVKAYRPRPQGRPKSSVS